MKMQTIRKILYVLTVFWMLGCESPYHWTPSREELVPLTDVEGILPQEGTQLILNLDYVFLTKFQTVEYTQQYRYRVLIDGEIYSYGVNSERVDCLSIPLMANDSYTRKTILVEGSMALEDISSKEAVVNPFITWSEWHELYRGEQECHPADKPLQYLSLQDSRLSIVIDGKTLTAVFADNSTAEAFKRYLSKEDLDMDMLISMSIRTNSSKERELISRLKSSIPDNHIYEWKVGSLYYANGGILIFLDEECSNYSYISLVGNIVPDDLSILKTLVHREDIYHTSATFSLK